MMKIFICAIAALLVSFGAAQAQSMNKTSPDGKQNAPGTTGAMGNVSNTGIATDPGGVKEQQGRSSAASPGTVGAAPGSTPPSKMKQ